MYAENSDVICANETWLNQNISNSEILHSGFTIFWRDRSDRGGGGVLISKQPPSKLSKDLNLNRKPSCNSSTEFYSVFAIGHPVKTQVGWMYSIIFCMKFVTSSTISVVILGDFNLPDILWDSIDSASGVNELAFIETLCCFRQ